MQPALLTSVKSLKISRFMLRYLMPAWLVFIVLSFSLYHQSPKKEELTTQVIRNLNRSFRFLSKTETLRERFKTGNGLVGAIRKNSGRTSGTAVCVVDPGMTECGGSGFSAFLLFTLDHIMMCRALGINQQTIFWRGCNSACSQDTAENSWTWYFEPVNEGMESRVENVFCPLSLGEENTEEVGGQVSSHVDQADLTTIIDNSFSDRSDLEGYNESRIITTAERIRVNKLIRQYVKPNYRVREKAELFHRRNMVGFTVLGVQVRATDHWMEAKDHKLPSMTSWVERAQEILKTLRKPRKIFIASDNNEVIQKFVGVFGKETVVFTEAFRSKEYHSQLPPHKFKFKYNATHPYERKIGTQVLVDILLLAKCNVFLHAESSVAALASYFNPHMTSYFMDER
ncbi:uncharacterized protein LOC111326573, partial [Stylophora pistillata]|uniref:uncharacterized protein LOC111326573 n=1 Tax=Stylophora pistillata TaxID=50429 RepID=UPI000C0433C8